MNIGTWADGFGIWHARVPLNTDRRASKRLAKAAILFEIQLRQAAYCPPSAVKLKMVDVADDGTIHYQEKSE